MYRAVGSMQGAGTDLKRLQELAQKLKFVPSEGRSIADVVFLDGSTTAEQVSRRSGRGMDMAAIRSLCQEAGGEVHMEPNLLDSVPN
jgi:chemotaxis protein histidine kinase CheA